MVQLKATPTQRGQTLLIGSDPINTVWHRARFSGACVASGGPEEGGGGEEQVALIPTAHDLFDAGLWTIDDNLRIQVAHSDISESILPGGSHFKLSDLT